MFIIFLWPLGGKRRCSARDGMITKRASRTKTKWGTKVGIGWDRQGRRLGCNVFVIDHRNSLGRLGIARVGWGAWIQTVCNLLKNVERLRGHASATKGS